MDNKNSLILFFLKRPVLVKLLTISFLLLGLFSFSFLKQELFPYFSLPLISIQMNYPGASAEDVAKGMVLPVENILSGMSGISEYSSEIVADSATVIVTVEKENLLDNVFRNIQSQVDAITTFPTDAKRPSVRILNSKDVMPNNIVSFVIFADTSQLQIDAWADKVYNIFREDKNFGYVEQKNEKVHELHVEINPATLERYRLTLSEIAQQMHNNRGEIAGGLLKVSSGRILLQVESPRETIRAIRDIPIKVLNGQRVLKLGEIAKIEQSFADSYLSYDHFNGKPAVFFSVSAKPDQTPIETSQLVKEKLLTLHNEVPVQAVVVFDRSTSFQERLHLLSSNALSGLLLIVGVLAIFMNIRSAFWVSFGMVFSIVVSFAFLKLWGVTFNMVTMFAFLIVLGVVVDDGIVVSESIHYFRKQGFSPFEAAARGIHEVYIPVIFSVLTNIAGFIPLLFLPGSMGQIFFVIPVVTITVLSISLLESIFFLPEHLIVEESTSRFGHAVSYLQSRVASGANFFIEHIYVPALRTILNWRYLFFISMCCFVAILFSIILTGRLGFSFFPSADGDTAQVTLKTNFPLTQAEAERYEEIVIKPIDLILKDFHITKDFYRGIYTNVVENQIVVNVFFKDIANFQRNINAQFSISRFMQEWENHMKGIPEVSLAFTSGGGQGGSDFSINLMLPSDSSMNLQEVLHDFRERLLNYKGVWSVSDNLGAIQKRWDISLNKKALMLGVNTSDLMQFLRGSFYGLNPFNIQKDRYAISVLVRMDAMNRSSKERFKNLKWQLPSGKTYLLSDLTDIKPTLVYDKIYRYNSMNSVVVTAKLAESTDSFLLRKSLDQEIFPELGQKFPGLQHDYSGQSKDLGASVRGIFWGFFFSLLLVYALLAMAFDNFLQPLIVMGVIPFSVVGVILGHYFFGYSLSIMSLLGWLALVGIVVNDSLLLVDTVNKNFNGMSYREAILDAVQRRFMPIFLTTVTTFFGVLPIVFETSRQAVFLIPMAISLGFGILGTTILTLFLVPVFYLMIEDIEGFFKKK